jgi:surface polysaccharide O-acyltransferase-like enzyme
MYVYIVDLYRYFYVIDVHHVSLTPFSFLVLKKKKRQRERQSRRSIVSPSMFCLFHTRERESDVEERER